MASDITAESTTDGWRGHPSVEWSEQEILNKALPFASSIGPDQKIAIGFDSRAGSRELALLAAHAFSSIGIRCIVASDITPTPAVGRFVASEEDIAAGLIFTASHNPPGDFGLKIRLKDGLPPIQSQLSSPPGPPTDFVSLLTFTKKSESFQIDDRINNYYRRTICKPLDLIVKNFPGEIVMDAMFGALSVLSDSLPNVKWRRNVAAPFFFGITPDPVLRKEAEKEMDTALSECKDPKNAIIFMTDGDGDRLCLYTHESGYVTSTEQAMALIHANLPVKQIISTCVVEATLKEVATRYDIDYRWTQVGFKNIIADWKAGAQGATIGVEPNGGLAYANTSSDFFERDGLGTASLILSRFTSVKALDDAIKEIRALRRFDYRQFVTPTRPNEVAELISNNWPGGIKEVRAQVYEITWPTGWRVLIRRSGTEPLTRCYVEGSNKFFNWFKAHLTNN